jgi:hypothetical protein
MSTEQFAISICRHVKTNGTRCQSPALHGEPFCYFHARVHKEHNNPLTARDIVNIRNLRYAEYDSALLGAGEDPMTIARAYPEQNEFTFPPLEDADSIQLAASMLFHAVAQGKIHLSRARLLRDILRVARASCPRTNSSAEPAQPVVSAIDHTAEGLAIAPGESPTTEITQNEPNAATPAEFSTEPTQNQDFAHNPLPDKILQTRQGADHLESGFCDFSSRPLDDSNPLAVENFTNVIVLEPQAVQLEKFVAAAR